VSSKKSIRGIRAIAVTVCAGCFLLTAVAWAGQVTEQIKQKVDKTLKILGDPALKAPGMETKRRQMLRAIADEIFNWEEMAKRSLGIHWKARTPEEKKEFVKLFSDLLDRTYMGKIEKYSGEKIAYANETIDGKYALLESKIFTKNDTEVAVNYWLINKDGTWWVYDVSVEGVSLIKNYRTQFNEILARSSYPELVKKIKSKEGENLKPKEVPAS
jgi:phospholipid transport system substrate-binding protein